MREFSIGDWKVLPDLNKLVRNGSEANIEPRVMAALVALAEHEGAVLSKDDFAQKVWRREIVSDDAILKIISKARTALDDDPQSPRFIETVRGRGYRLLPQAAGHAASDPVTPARRRYRPAVIAAAGAAVLTLAAGAIAVNERLNGGEKVIFLNEDDPVQTIRIDTLKPVKPLPSSSEEEDKPATGDGGDKDER